MQSLEFTGKEELEKLEPLLLWVFWKHFKWLPFRYTSGVTWEWFRKHVQNRMKRLFHTQMSASPRLLVYISNAMERSDGHTSRDSQNHCWGRFILKRDYGITQVWTDHHVITITVTVRWTWSARADERLMVSRRMSRALFSCLMPPSLFMSVHGLVNKLAKQTRSWCKID